LGVFGGFLSIFDDFIDFWVPPFLSIFDDFVLWVLKDFSILPRTPSVLSIFGDFYRFFIDFYRFLVIWGDLG